MLEAILQLFPLDEYDKANCISVMEVVPGDKNADETPPIWSKFDSIAKKAEGDWVKLKPIERFMFYREAKEAFCVIATSETAIYANVILKKGIIKPKSQ
jgi:L-fucose mutarotase